MPASKSDLDFYDAVRVAYLHLCRDIPQQTLAVVFEVNSGRINEVMQTVREALKEYDNAPEIRRHSYNRDNNGEPS